MLSFGEQLRKERESRHATLEEVAGATKIGLPYLEALERNDFKALPGLAFGKFYIRAYAELLGFDPKPLIAEYDRQHHDRIRAERAATKEIQERLAAAEHAPAAVEPAPLPLPEPEPEPEPILDPEPVAEIEPAPEALPVPAPADPDSIEELPPVEPAAEPARPVTAIPAEPVAIRREGNRRTVTWVVVLVAIPTLIWVVVLLRPLEAPPAVQDAVIESARELPPPTPSGPEPDPVSEIVAAEPSATLTVSEHGIGLRVANRRLEGRGDRFTEGQSVSFLTRVLGGRRGQTIRHVWLREGRIVQSITLPLGGQHWRTHSSKTLWGQGEWAVEARDADGRVLARDEFICAR